MQTTVLLITLLSIAALAVAFLLVIARSHTVQNDYANIASRAYRIRRWWLFGLCAFGVIISLLTLRPFPLTAKADVPPRVINAEGGQWYWNLDADTAVVGEALQFHVTAVDVNHGFALYGPDDRIVAQIQAMPGYTNKVNVRFTEAGVYRILCLEYCGLAHHNMTAEIRVADGEQ